MLPNIIDFPYLAIILASLAGIAVFDGLICAMHLNTIEGVLEALFAGGSFTFAAISINTNGIVRDWLDQSDFANWALVAMTSVLVITAIAHIVRVSRRIHRQTVVIDDTTPADTTEE